MRRRGYSRQAAARGIAVRVARRGYSSGISAQKAHDGWPYRIVTGRNLASCGGPAANSHTGSLPAGSDTKDELTVPNPPRGTTLSCSAASPLRSARRARQRVPGRFGGLEARQMEGGSRAFQVVRIIGGDHGNAGRQRGGARGTVAEAVDEPGAGPIRQHHVEAAPEAGVQAGESCERPRRPLDGPAPSAAGRRGCACRSRVPACRAGSAPSRRRRAG